jgi:hypothetical protein
MNIKDDCSCTLKIVRALLPTLTGLGAALGIISILSGTIRFWDQTGLVLFGGAFLPVLICLFLIFTPWALYFFLTFKKVSVVRAFKSSLTLRNRSIFFAFVFGTVGIIVSDWTCGKEYSFFAGPSFRGELLLSIGFAFYFLRHRSFLKSTAIITPLFLYALFLLYLNGRLLLSDDHATFIYRISLLKSEFPSIPFYLPLWNAGIDVRDFFATGLLGFFLIFSPIIYLFNINDSYNFLIASLLFLITPLCHYSSVRFLLRYGNRTAAIASLLSMLTSLIVYRWSLKYGTIGFITSISLLPLVISCLIKVFNKEKTISRPVWITTIASLSLLSLWTPAILMLTPLAPFFVFSINRLSRKKGFLALVAVLILVNTPWMLLFWKVSNVSSFLHHEKKVNHSAYVVKKEAFRHASSSLNPKGALLALRKEAHSANPLLVMGIIVGIPLLRKRINWFWSATSLWLLLVGTFGVNLKPQLELDRFLIALLSLSALPTAVLLDRACRLYALARHWHTKMYSASCVGLLMASIISIAHVVQNRSIVQFAVEGPLWKKMETTIKENSNGGRILFSGCVIHQFNEAHLAPLALSTNTPLIASSHLHNIWWYTDIIPANVSSGGEESIINYLDELNVTAVFAHEKIWRKLFQNSKEFYFVEKVGQFSLFKRKSYKSNYFYQGEGTIVREARNHVTLKVASANVILKYKWLPFLTSSSCDLSSFTTESGLSLISLKNCPLNKEINITSINPWSRYLLKEY